MNIPLFPNQNANQSMQGITLRDYFATEAMAAMISQYPPDESEMWQLNNYRIKDLAFRAYQHADVMLQTREFDMEAGK